ncbi:hypothetical protein PHLGIDRAFT_73196 [Phlebiopsis gigantea 11061_1 CR5-6]|uniref:Protein kinase domain-containing protein n=1 Tax=Phlebiopsis gigantea (strain 11061_1 CR5-6) TaxID=745531 RepID=A0A0C3NM12_PHLG1|nr:hypothetical protein PHLGIDRAFT_73196 [Phlebiopsis gigantea 11061_1 CR5-6]
MVGKLHRISEFFPVTIEEALRNYKVLTEEEIRPAAEFIRSCVRLDPSERLTAEEIVQHPWLSSPI